MADINPDDSKTLSSESQSGNNDIFLFGFDDTDYVDVDNYILAKGFDIPACVYGITIYGIGL